MTLPVENDAFGSRAAATANAELSARRPGKAAGAFRTISEVASDLNVPQHVLRFWETRFAQIRPLKRAGGRRYYRPEDVELLRRIRQLLYNNGYTIKGVQRLLRDLGRRPDGEGAAPDSDIEIEPPPSAAAAVASAVEDAIAAPARPGPSPGGSPGRRAEVEAALRELTDIRDGLRRLRR